ncbi:MULTISPECIES: hypothetical protein [unclassified Caballeronia]|uniref:hypothetical protein n=1 Tax=unclassified Caballeronia TaxID=2646786 RepID=UPI00285953F5|nr:MULTISPECIES: hypothetical protein [unclassified Caballeronia]MDR5750245.1 hypothetical protein [Caballeronia sp. LZ024]MDR5844916.1 hypothetical protein [Caballeronia sp. LZ031]
MNLILASKRYARRFAVSGAALAWVAGIVQPALAKPGGEPLVLDTQTGIHSGVPGTVLQTGPLNAPGMVQARPMANLPELAPQEQAPIIVSPYVTYPGSQTTDQSAQPPRFYRPTPH